MPFKKLTTLLVVDAIEPCLPAWKNAGYAVTVQVPDAGPAGFVILAGPAGELMLQTRSSLAEDVPAVAARKPSHLLYADVASLEASVAELSAARVLVPHRKTFYGANEVWLELEGGFIIGLSSHD